MATSVPAPRERKHALAGDGPIVDRARRALRMVGEQFGTVTKHDQRTVTVQTADGIALVLSYNPSNYVFSRVYNLTITFTLPEHTNVPSNIVLSHKGRNGMHFVPKKPTKSASSTPPLTAENRDKLAKFNNEVAAELGTIDLIEAHTSSKRSVRSLTLTPMGGSYVWVLIPPVFKATTFPPGEVDRIHSLIRTICAW